MQPIQPRAPYGFSFFLPSATPLASLLHVRQKQKEFSPRLAGLLEPFSLKHALISEVSARHCVINGRRLVNFGSAHYLGLEQHPEVLYAAKRAIDERGIGSDSSRQSPALSNIVELEGTLSLVVGAEASLVGQSVSQVHAGVLPALFGNRDSVLFIDKQAQESMWQGVLSAKAEGARIVHVDVSDPPALRKILARERPRRGALLVNGVFAIQGHSADLAGLDELCRSANLILYVDDSHGVGVFGANGGGSVEACGLRWDNLLLVGSLQNAFGASGGFISGLAPILNFLRIAGRPCLVSETLPPSAVEGALAAVRIARSSEGNQLRSQLAERSRQLRAELTELGFIVPPGDSPIISVTIGKDLKTLMAGRKLFDLGIFLSPVVFPAMPRGRGVLRISLSAIHTEIDLEALRKAFRELRIYLLKYENPLRQAAHVAFELGKARWHGASYGGLQQ